MAGRHTEDTLANPETSYDRLPSRTAPSDAVTDMLGFDPRELNMLGFDLYDDGV